VSEVKSESSKRPVGAVIVVGVLGFVLGVIATGLGAYAVMPGQMIVTKECKMGVAETVTALKESIAQHGWVLSGVGNMNESLKKQGVDFEPQVRVVKLCHPQHAKKVLTTDRHIASMMPCTLAVWEGDDGKTYLSQMNMGLMAKLFGGNVAKVMGGAVAQDEHAIIASLVVE